MTENDVLDAHVAGFDAGQRAGYELAGGDLAARLIAMGPELAALSVRYEGDRWNEATIASWARDAVGVLRQLVEVIGGQDHPDADVIASVVAERARQDAKWGAPHDPARGDGTGEQYEPRARHAKLRTDAHAAAGRLTWMDILAEEVAEAFAESDPVRLRAELVQVAAVAVKWVRVLDSRQGRVRK